jgi:Type II secretion system (T2SS), protein M subtype b
MIGTQRLSLRTIGAVAAFLGLLLLTIFLGVGYLITNRDLQDEFETKTRMLETLTLRARQTVSAGGNPAQVTTESAVIAGSTETVAASELQRSILTAVQDSGGSVHSIQAEVTTDKVDDGLRRLSAQTTFDSSLVSLQKALFGLETKIPFIFIESISVQPAPISVSGATTELLRVTIVASSYWKSFSANGDAH